MSKKFRNSLIGLGLGLIVYSLVLLSHSSIKDSILNSPSNSPTLATSTNSAVLGQSSTEYPVARVIDGDIIEVLYNGKNEKVRLIGMDTPETVDPRRPVGCFGHEASNETKSLLEGKQVTMEADIEDRDKFGRLLRYVYLDLDQDKLMVNDYLVREGFARVDTIPPDVKYTARFLNAQQDAQKNLRGLWNPATCNGK